VLAFFHHRRRRGVTSSAIFAIREDLYGAGLDPPAIFDHYLSRLYRSLPACGRERSSCRTQIKSRVRAHTQLFISKISIIPYLTISWIVYFLNRLRLPAIFFPWRWIRFQQSSVAGSGTPLVRLPASPL